MIIGPFRAAAQKDERNKETESETKGWVLSNRAEI